MPEGFSRGFKCYSNSKHAFDRLPNEVGFVAATDCKLREFVFFYEGIRLGEELVLFFQQLL